MGNNKITLSQIGLYNPQRLSDEVVEKMFVVRTKYFQFLMDKLRKEKPNSIPQHHLIIAQRGMGKTTILKRIEVELRKKEYLDVFIPLLFREEQYNLKNMAAFWLNSLDALADTLEFEKKTEQVKTIDAKIKELEKIKSLEDRAKQAFQFLKTFTKSINRRPVLLTDNMSIIFDRMNKDEQHTLRAWLMQNGAPIVIGASAVAIENTFDYGAPFYDAFQIHYLKKLSFEELLDILNNLAKLTDTESVLTSVQNQMARVKTLHQLTGGNPRTASMLFKLIVKGFSKEINDDLEALLDEITPLYKARFEELPTQMQVILDAIALFWDPINLEQLRDETGYENNQLSPQLKRLAEVGWIEKIDAYQAKGNAYQISERFFNIWFLMRRSSRRKKKELYCLSKFLESFYGDEINTVAQTRLQSKAGSLDHITYSLALAEATKNENLKSQLREKSYEELLEFSKSNPEILKQFDLPDKTKTLNVEALIQQYYKEYKSGNYEIAESLILAVADLTKMDKELNAKVFNEIGNLYQNNLAKYDEAEKAYKTAIKLDNENANPWNNLGNLYQNNLAKYEEAEKAYKKAIELDQKDASPWNNLGNLYTKYLAKYDEAEKAYKKAIELDQKDAYPWNGLGNLYKNNLAKYEEAEKAYKTAIELDQKLANPWNGIGNLYQDHLQKFEEAENSYKKAIDLDKKFVVPKFNLVFLYRDKMNKIEEAEKLFNTLGKDEEVEDSYWLNKALFELYKRNEGIAKGFVEKAFIKIQGKFPVNTQDDWWRFGAIVTKMSYGAWLLALLEENGYDIILAPYYVAIKAMNEKNTEGYLNSKAVEIREPAIKIIEIMKRYQR